MQVVGQFLSDFAMDNRETNPQVSLFARSAFNRYYYAIFLTTRRLIVETTGVSKLPHKDLPNYLIGPFRKTIKQKIKTAVRSGMLSHAYSASQLDALKQNTHLLSQILVTAYSVRVLADYEPDVAVEFKDQTYKLGASTLSEATNWASRAQIHCKSLYKVWRNLGN